MLNIPAGWKPISSAPEDGTDILLTNGVHVSCGHWHYDEGGTTEHRDLDGRYIGQDDRDGFAGWFDWMGGMTPNPTHWMPLPAAPGSTSSAPGDAQDEDDSIALDKLADYIADTWPDKKYGLEEICQRLHAMWPGEFLSAADLEKNDPNVREALRALLLWWNRFQASDGDPKDACELLVKGARSAWQFAEVEIDRVPVPAPAAGDALDAARLDWLEQHDGSFYNKDRISSIVGTGFLVAGDEQGVRHQTVRAAIDAAIAAQQVKGGEA